MKTEKPINTIIRWIARIWSLLSIAFILYMVIGHLFGSEPQTINSTKDILAFSFFPTDVLIGLLIAWKWEGLGGIITIGSVAGLYVLRPDLIGNLLIGAVAAPGILFLVYWIMVRQKRETRFNNF